jgi:hypothetical protein
MTKLKKESNKLALEALAARLKAGANYEDFDKEVDKLLKTGLTERDIEAEGDWEHYNKGVEAGLDGK